MLTPQPAWGKTSKPRSGRPLTPRSLKPKPRSGVGPTICSGTNCSGTVGLLRCRQGQSGRTLGNSPRTGSIGLPLSEPRLQCGRECSAPTRALAFPSTPSSTARRRRRCFGRRLRGTHPQASFTRAPRPRRLRPPFSLRWTR
jgi:hypothetical protein